MTYTLWAGLPILDRVLVQIGKKFGEKLQFSTNRKNHPNGVSITNCWYWSVVAKLILEQHDTLQIVCLKKA